MAKGQKNANIGMVECGYMGCTEIAAVRRNNSGRLYTFCLSCGQLEPRNLSGADAEGGQSRILERAQIWGEDGQAPPAAPWWIAENWTAERRRNHPDTLKPWGGGAPAELAPEPTEQPEPEDVPTPPKAKPKPKNPRPQPEPKPAKREPDPAPAKSDDWW